MTTTLETTVLTRTRGPVEPGLLAGGATLLAEPVAVARAGAADRLDGRDGAARESWSSHLARFGERPAGGGQLLEALEASGLTGYGGGHFPAARKWRSLVAAGPVETVVANGAESEPLSAKDATLLRQRPHLVIDGLLCAMETVGAVRGVVWLHGGDRRTAELVGATLAERRDLGGRIRVVRGPDTYLAGESSAILRALSGGPALPVFRADPSRPIGRSTLLHNVETLARVALVARTAGGGRSAPSAAGVPGTATTLLTVVGSAARYVVEVPRDASLAAALQYVEGREPRPEAVLLAGYGGTWAAWSQVSGCSVTETALRARCRTLGPGIVAPLPAHGCGLAETARMLSYLATSSARQCGPCRFGLPALAASMAALAAGRAPRRELRRLADDLEAVRGRGGCHHPDGAVRLASTALETFGADLECHLRRSPCAGSAVRIFPVPQEA